MGPTPLKHLAPVSSRITFIYLERCTIGRDESALTATDDEGVCYIPSASATVLLLGPGTRITHQAMLVAADSGTSMVWCGENGVRYYASGRPLGRTSRYLIQQAKLVSSRSSRLAVARAMYAIRFGEDTKATVSMTMQQLRGREGARMRRTYKTCATDSGITWTGRDYNPEDFAESDPVNQALSAANACLYGICHAVVAALGLAPGLGFIHTGTDRSFIYDIADLYKADITIPIAFAVAAKHLHNEPGYEDISAATRYSCRAAFRTEKILTRIVNDVLSLLGSDNSESESHEDIDVLELWDDKTGSVEAGINYHRHTVGDTTS